MYQKLYLAVFDANNSKRIKVIMTFVTFLNNKIKE